MTCIKTGFHAKLECYDEWLYGDAFELDNGGAWIFRVCQRSRTHPIRGVKHFTIQTYDHWFDDSMTSMEWNSTLICRPHQVDYHDYDGISI